MSNPPVAAPSRTRRRRRLWYGFWALLLASILLIASAGIWLPAMGNWLACTPVPVAAAEAIAVHGGDPSRTDYAIGLYGQHIAPALWHTGYASTKHEISAYVLDRGVPADSFWWLDSTSTWTDGAQIAALAQERGIQTIVVVTDWTHSRRALSAIRAHSTTLNLRYSPSPSPIDPPDHWWESGEGRATVLREFVKLGYYRIRYGMVPTDC